MDLNCVGLHRFKHGISLSFQIAITFRVDNPGLRESGLWLHLVQHNSCDPFPCTGCVGKSLKLYVPKT